ncbi:hypothetical protein BCR43DRAFT_498143 [Syncephalastrum racemosum]|uniref:BZIP domain-containing protein n=1 Tax=Syncephalastrum racemosum TaxID=13706 RepID=A0A1X2H3E5_SYNRA|nr:hypothetical protein BCR43DRAFT_498143 [Syncephalastrum racemosum]
MTDSAKGTPVRQDDHNKPDSSQVEIEHGLSPVKRPADQSPDANKDTKARRIDNDASHSDAGEDAGHNTTTTTAAVTTTTSPSTAAAATARDSTSTADDDNANTTNNNEQVLNEAASAAAAAAAAAAAVVDNPTHLLGDGAPAVLPILTEQQQQQLLQSYAQQSGQDLANLTASSLAQAMVSPIAVPGMTALFHQLQANTGNVITALPGPPPALNHAQPHAHPHPHPSSHPHPHHPNQQVSEATNNASDTQPNNSANQNHANGAESDGQKNSYRSLSNDERRQRRLLRNRMAAKECRKKKKQYIQEMEDKILHLEEENTRLKNQVEELNAKLALGAIQGTSESYRLMKEVEELNAKLGGMAHFPSSGALTSALVAAASSAQNGHHPAQAHSNQSAPSTSQSQPQPQPQQQSQQNPPQSTHDQSHQPQQEVSVSPSSQPPPPPPPSAEDSKSIAAAVKTAAQQEDFKVQLAAELEKLSQTVSSAGSASAK